MKIIFERIFLKDIKKLDSKISLKLKEIFIELEKSNSLWELKNIRKMIWYDNYYRIRIWDYRLWIKNDDDKCIVLRFKHRKDIYKNFP